MYRFADQIEFRVDRRQVLLFFLGGLVWTFVAFFLGMLIAGGHQRPVEKGLAALGWLDKEALSSATHNKPTSISFQSSPHSQPTPARKKLAHLTISKSSLQDPPTHKTNAHRARIRAHNRTRRQRQRRAKQRSKKRQRLALQRALRPRDDGEQKNDEDISKMLARRPHARKHHPRAPKRITPSHNDERKYTVSVSLPRNKRKVLRIYKKLQKRGYRPLLARIATSRGRLYRITLGRFPTRRAALLFASRLKKQTRLRAFALKIRR